MIEIKVTVEIPGMTEAINNLAQAIAEKKPVAVEAVKQEAPAVQASAPVAPVAAPVAPVAPVQPPVQTAPAPAPVAPVVASVTPTVTAASAPAQQQAPTAAKRITLDDLSLAGAKLVDAGKMDALINALQNFGVAAITLLREDQYASFADCLRSLGANI
ncbi:MAG: hypothetical protein ACLSIT_02285 [Christensenellales bacterium]|jgi:hypothetical protein|nr:hypothetical protein [Christensenellales bacterium]